MNNTINIAVVGLGQIGIYLLNELKNLSNKFKELKSLIYEYRDKKEKEINALLGVTT